MNKIYEWIDRVWQWIAETVFVRFQFDLPVDTLKNVVADGRLVLCLTHGGFVEWLILSSWCRREGLGAILVANRKRILLFSKPKYFFQIVFRQKKYSDLFLSDEPGPRVLFVVNRERKQLFEPTGGEILLCDIYSAGEAPRFTFFPIFILWRKHMRDSAQFLSEYFFGLSSNPNVVGKIWYLWRKRIDSIVRALAPLKMVAKELPEGLEGMEESEAMRIAKNTRRRILIEDSHERRVVLGPRYLSPHSLKETLMRDPEIQRVIDETAAKEGVDRKKVMQRAYADLTEIAANYHFRFIEVMYVLLTYVFNKVFDGLVADEAEIVRVREVMKAKPVVFVPCHRSHLDYLVLPYLFFTHDIVTPHIAAGINLAFWPAGYFLRKGGGFFIRRSFRGDPLYSVCLKRYVQYLIRHRYNLKFFIEGTRSRSGKMLAPAYGILKMVTETVQQHVVEDIALIPVSLCYDEVPEQASYTKELSGGAKTKESTTELLKSRKFIKKNIGKVYVRFAEPLSVKNTLSGDDEKLALQKTAFQICKSINDVTPVTPKSLVSTILLAHRLSALSLEEILRLSEMLQEYVRWTGTQLSVEPGDPMKRAVEQTVRRLQKSGVASVSDSVPRTYYCENRKRVVLNFYKNNAIHCLNVPAITLLSFFACARDDRAGFVERFIQTAVSLRNLLKFEFFFNPTAVFVDEIKKNLRYFVGDYEGRSTRELFASLGKRFGDWSDVSVFTRLLGDLIESYYTAAEFLKDTTERSWEKKALVQRLVKFGETRAAQGAIAFPESISVQNYTNALLLFDNLKFTTQTKEEDKTMIQLHAWDDRMATLQGSLKAFLDLMGENPETFATLSGSWSDNRLPPATPSPMGEPLG